MAAAGSAGAPASEPRQCEALLGAEPDEAATAQGAGPAPSRPPRRGAFWALAAAAALAAACA
ncbi:unnamed protein product, partial [Prorocentrum cordatum]